MSLPLGWGLLSQFPPFRYFPNFSESQKHALAIEYHIYIWQVSPQLSCGDTCQIWMWSKESNRYFCKIENFACGEISQRSFSNPHTWTLSLNIGLNMLPSDSIVSCQFRISTRIFYTWVPGFATICPSGVWCRGLTTCPLYAGPLFFWKSILKW